MFQCIVLECSSFLVRANASFPRVMRIIVQVDFTRFIFYYFYDRLLANLICSSGFFARANQLFYRFGTEFRLRNSIISWYESYVRLITLACVQARPICAREGSYVSPFLYVPTRIRTNPLAFLKIQIRDSYELFYK